MSEPAREAGMGYQRFLEQVTAKRDFLKERNFEFPLVFMVISSRKPL
jgi:hypothetical protein